MFELSSVDLEIYHYRLNAQNVVRFHTHMTISEVMGIRMFSVFDPDSNLLTFFNVLPADHHTGTHC